MSKEQHIKALEDAGYIVSAPRDTQGEFALNIARVLEGFNLTVLKPYRRDKLRIEGLSYISLRSIRDGINEMLGSDDLL